ncbi:MAG: MBL fold metallo-hydrolase [Anaerolineaceae bacterium]|nr:MBL fold metallo-hydrolase [Anaerolineaceae bacterium]
MSKQLEKLSDHLYLFRDTCNVYVLREEEEALLIDFGSGEVLDHLSAIGVERVSDVLITHHHRDQTQGLARAAARGIRIWVPHQEQDLIARVDQHWQARNVLNNYNVRQDRFSLLESVPTAGTLKDYAVFDWRGWALQVIPTPGHTTGSISLLVEFDGARRGFTGDLIYAPGKVWSLSATQWTYNGAEGIPASIASLLDLKDRAVDQFLPSHGDVIAPVGDAVDLTVANLWALLNARQQNPRLFQLRETPYERVTEHVLRHRASMANTYVLRSESGKAMIFDFGYDFITGIPAGTDRASRRPWLYTIPMLKKTFGVEKIDVVLPTHYHDDHVAGINLLRDVEGARHWAPENFAQILEQPHDYDLPCLWYDPIPVDRVLPIGEPIVWEEYTLTLHALPGHTRYAVAIAFEADGERVLVTGDQYQGDEGQYWNYVYQNRYQIGDYLRTARLIRDLRPDLILSGHWMPLWVRPEYLERIVTEGAALERYHRDLLPEEPDLGGEGFLARFRPYHAHVSAGSELTLEVEIRNPYPQPAEASLELILPEGWDARESVKQVMVDRISFAAFQVQVPPGLCVERARAAVDVRFGEDYFGQQAEVLISVCEKE